MFEGLRSRWTTRFWWAACTAAHDTAEEGESFRNRQAMPVGVQIDPLAVDVFHDEVWNAVVRRAAVEQPRDVAVIQAGEDLALRSQPVVIGTTHETGPHEFHGDLMAVFADSFGEIHVAHAAATQPATQSPRAEHLAGAVYLPERFVVLGGFAAGRCRV